MLILKKTKDMKNMGFQKDFSPVLRFIALSDVHYKDEHTVERDRMKRAIELGYSLSRESETHPSLDALYVIGDFANRGTEEQMLAFYDTLKAVKPETEKTITLASHEFMSEEPVALERFARIFAMEPDTHKVINGFHFIAVTTTRGCHFSEEKIAWVNAELEKSAAAAPGKPIFFFQHPHVSGTVYGSKNWGEDELYTTLMNYPQIINFSGHSHAPVNDPRSVHQQHFTSFGTGSLSYFELDEFDKIYGTCPPDEAQCAQMLFVEADKDGRVRVYPYDILSENFFPFVWEIDRPWDTGSFSYTDEIRYKCDYAPYFAPDDAISVSDVERDGFDITFPQAKADKEYVNSYDVTVRDKKSGLTVKKVSFWSHYYLYNMPETITYTVTDLAPATDYEVEIYANGFWFNRSPAPIKTEVRTGG